MYDPGRLKVVNPCVTVTGVVATAPDPSNSDDGDVTFHLVPDPAFSNLLNAASNGHLHVEAICQAPIKSDEPAAAKACAGFQGSVLIPPLGAHVSITGSYVLDTNHQNWAEIHPVTVITVIP